MSDEKLVIVNNSVLSSYSNQFLTTTDTTPTRKCCCPCDPKMLKNSDVEVVVDPGHCCNCAKYQLSVNGKRLQDFNFNNADQGPQQCVQQGAKFTTDLDEGTEIDPNDGCCVIVFRLDCKVAGGDIAGFGGDFTCAQQFGDPPCHSSITLVNIKLPTCAISATGYLPSNTDVKLKVCAGELKGAFFMGFSTPPYVERITTAGASGCPCCDKFAQQRQRMTRNIASGVGTNIKQLVERFLFSGDVLVLAPSMLQYIEAADKIPVEDFKHNVQALVNALRWQAKLNDWPFDERAADIIVRRAISLSTAASK